MRHVLTRQFAISILAAAILAGCGSDNKRELPMPPEVPAPAPAPSPDPVAQEYQGNWVAPGYGLTFSMGADSVEIFQYTSDYCFYAGDDDELNTAEVERLLRHTENQNELEWYSGTGTETFGAPGARFQKVDALPASCQGEVIATDGSAADDYDATELFAMYSQIFEEYYVDFERNNVNWADVSQSGLASLNVASSDDDLLDVMEATLMPLADGHNYVKNAQGKKVSINTKVTLLRRLVDEFAASKGISFPFSTEQATEQLIKELNQYVDAHLENQWSLVTNYAEDDSDIKYAANGLIRWFKNDGLGYLFVGGMMKYAENTEDDELIFAQDTLANLDAILDEALTDLADTQGLILDVRMNNGGYDYVSLAIASRFTPDEFHAYSKQARDGNGRTELLDVYVGPRSDIQYPNPVALLTSASTVSAAEVFTMVMSQLPQVTLVGTNSHGALSNVLEWQLPNGFKVGMSNEFYLTPDGAWYEGTGIPVDVEVPFYTQEQREMEVDLGIEAAAAILAN